MMSRMHYNAIAALIAGERSLARHSLNGGTRAIADGEAVLRVTRNMALSMGDIFARDNDRFDRARFYKACGITDPHSEIGE